MGFSYKRLVQVVVLGGAVIATMIALGVGSASASASASGVRVGATATLPRGAHLNGALPSGKPLSLTVALQSQDAAGLQSFATAVSTPGTPEYHHYLSVPEFAQRFGATSAQIAAVQDAFRAQGMTVGQPTANNLTIPVSGTAAQVERALSVSLQQVTLAGGRVAYANTSAPVLPANVASAVQGVIGLNSLTLPQPQSLHRAHAALRRPALARPNVVTGGPAPSCSGALAQQTNGYTADFIASAYKFSNLYLAGDAGAGQTIAMYELEPFDPQDITTYQSCYGTNVPVAPINVDGGPGTYGTAGNTDDGEAALDIEQAIGMAPGASILVYQAPNSASGALDAYAAIVSQNRAKIVSSSWGSCEAQESAGASASIRAENTLFQEAAAQGQSIFVATGDSGSAACSQSNASNTGLSVGDPASQPFATAVGGTTLYAGSNDNPVLYSPGQTPQEGVWNEGAPNGPASASTGGLSTQWPMPAYQQGAAASLGVINANSIVPGISCGSTYCREVPDVSADADAMTGYVVNANQNQGGGWTVIGGTSAAAPLWAAFTALVNADSACRGVPAGFLNPHLYALAGSSYLNNFTDITQPNPVTHLANNDALGVNQGLFPVTANYDMATGIGSMIAPTLASSLCALTAPAYTVAVASPGNLVTTVGTPVALALHGGDSGGAGLAFGGAGLPLGLTINPATGIISGTPTTVENTGVTVTAADAFTNSGSTSFTWSVVNPPPPPVVVGGPKAKSVKISGLAARRPKLTLTLNAGANAPALKSVAITLPSGLSFAGKVKTLDTGLKVTNGAKRLKFGLKIKRGMLTITFKSATRTAALTLTRPAITITGSEAAKIRKHKVKKLTFKLKTTDASHRAASLTIKLKKLS